MKPNHPLSTILVRLFALAILLLAAGNARAQSGAASDATPETPKASELGIITSWGTSSVWKPVDPDVDPKPAEAKLRAALTTLHAAHPDDLLVDLGGYASPKSAFETVYDFAGGRLFLDNKYDVVNCTARDYLYALAHGTGMKARASMQKFPVLSAIDRAAEITNEQPASVLVESKAGPIRFATMAERESLAALPVQIKDSRVNSGEGLLDVLVDADDAPIVVMSDLPPARNEAIARAYPRVGVIFELRASGDVRKVGGSYIIGAQRPWELQQVRIRFDEKRRVASVNAVRTPWTEEKDFARLDQAPLPVIGVSIPGDNRLATRLNLPSESVEMDVHRDVAFPELTTRKNIYAYTITVEGRKYRGYRVTRSLGLWMLPFDAMIFFDEAGLIRRIESNGLSMPIVNYDTRMPEALQSLVGKPYDQWKFPPELTRGIEEHTDRVLDAIRKTYLLDQTLYRSAKGAPAPAAATPASGGVRQ